MRERGKKGIKKEKRKERAAKMFLLNVKRVNEGILGTFCPAVFSLCLSAACVKYTLATKKGERTHAETMDIHQHFTDLFHVYE